MTSGSARATFNQTMQKNSTPHAKENARPRFETRPEPSDREETKNVDPEPHWEMIIDAATD
jgi:hypothetical protein